MNLEQTTPAFLGNTVSLGHFDDSTPERSSTGSTTDAPLLDAAPRLRVVANSCLVDTAPRRPRLSFHQ